MKLHISEYKDILKAVANNKSFDYVKEHCPPDVSERIIKELYDRAVEEHWTKIIFHKSKIGRFLYE